MFLVDSNLENPFFAGTYKSSSKGNIPLSNLDGITPNFFFKIERYDGKAMKFLDLKSLKTLEINQKCFSDYFPDKRNWNVNITLIPLERKFCPFKESITHGVLFIDRLFPYSQISRFFGINYY